MTIAMARGRIQFRFLVAGAANTALGLSIYPLLLWGVPALHGRYLLALAFAQIASLCFAFMTYKAGVFRTRGNLLREFATFTSFYVANYAANWAVLPLLVEVARISPVPAQCGFTAILIAGSWFWHSRVTFRRRNPK